VKTTYKRRRKEQNFFAFQESSIYCTYLNFLSSGLEILRNVNIFC